MKLNSLFMGRIGRLEGRKFFGSQPTHDEFCHKKNPILWLLRFFDMLLATLWALFSCLRLRQWPVTYLITLSDWTMSCQPGPPRARYGQWPRWQQRPAGGTFPYKMANFHGVNLIFGRIDSTEFFIWYRENCLTYCHKISNWYNDPVLCYHRVKYAILQWADKGAAIIFTSMRERHLRKCPDA